jgi:hypothetical protein
MGASAAPVGLTPVKGLGAHLTRRSAFQGGNKSAAKRYGIAGTLLEAILKLTLCAAAIAALIPSLALAQESCEQRAQNRAAGTAIGAIAGALIGNSVSGHDRTAGTVAGALGGGIIGNQLAKGPADCQHAYGWYDNDGRWHANNVSSTQAYGYYDRQGAWVEGQPQGYYRSDGVWVAQTPVQYANPDNNRSNGQYNNGQYNNGQYNNGYNNRPQSFGGYPQFAGLENHIQKNIEEGARDDLIDPYDARDFTRQLEAIRAEEVRDYRSYGRNLPRRIENRLQQRLQRLDDVVDRTREEP